MPCEASNATTRGTSSFTTSAFVKPLLFAEAASACSAGIGGGEGGGGGDAATETVLQKDTSEPEL